MAASKKLKITIITVSAVVTVLILVAILCLYFMLFIYGEFTHYTPAQREILLMNYDTIDYEKSGDVELKREISPNRPINLVNYHGKSGGITQQWEAIPLEIRDISVLVIKRANLLSPKNADSLSELDKIVAECSENKIPYAVEIANDQTQQEWLLPMSYLEKNLLNNEFCYGVTLKGLNSAAALRGKLDGDLSGYFADTIRISAKYGAFVFWQDANANGDNGTIIDWVENSEYLYSTMKANASNIMLLNDEYTAQPSTNSIALGMYLGGLIGGWGVATDPWHWQAAGHDSLYDDNNKIIDSDIERMANYPEAMHMQSMTLALSHGGFCYSNELQFTNGKEVAGYRYGIAPFMQKLIDGTYEIPTKQQLLNKITFAVVGGNNYEPINYNGDESNLYPHTGMYGIIPLLPANIDGNIRTLMTDNKVQLIEQKATAEVLAKYADTSVGGDTFITKMGNSYYYVNNVENADVDKTGTVNKFYKSGAKSMSITASPHTYAIINESVTGLRFSINNYRTDKTDLLGSIQGDIGINELLGNFCLDEDGNPIGVYDLTLRTTVIKVRMEQGRVAPQISFITPSDGSADSRPFVKNVGKISDELGYTYVITIQHNGLVEFEITTGSPSGHIGVPKAEVNNQSADIDANPQYLAEAAAIMQSMENIIANRHNYTRLSVWNILDNYGALSRIIDENINTDKEISAIIKNAKLSLELALDITKPIEALRFYRAGTNDKLDKAFDVLMRELTSPTDYIEGKENGAELLFPYARDKYNKDLYRVKNSEIQKAYKILYNLLLQEGLVTT